MYFTGFTRFSSDVQKVNEKSADEKVKQHLQMLELVDEAERILIDDTTDLDDFGHLLDHTWKLKSRQAVPCLRKILTPYMTGA